MTEIDQPEVAGPSGPELGTDAQDQTQPAVDRITVAAAAVAGVAELPLAEHAERYQQLHATLQAELGGIAHL